jgi:diguanylate cyclase (GGDEF)-like protein/PAS domain S-box-containing protein
MPPLLWAASGLLIALLLHAARKQWPLFLALAALGGGLAALWAGAAPALVGAIVLAQIAEGWIGARLLQRHKRRESDLLREWLADAAAIAFAAPVAGGLCLLAVMYLAVGTAEFDLFVPYVLAHGIGNLVFFPLFSMIVSRDFGDRASRRVFRRQLSLAGFLVAVAATGGWALWQPNFLPLLVPILVALLATCRFGMPAATLSVVALALVAWGVSLAGVGVGPELAFPAVSPDERQFLQFYLALAVACLQPLARHLTQNRRLAFALMQKDLSGVEIELSLQAKDHAIGESQELYRLLAENMTDVVLKTDRGGCVLYASPSLERRAGIHPSELIGRPILELIHPSYGASFLAELDEMITGRKDSAWIEYLGIASDGEERWFDTQIRCSAESHGAAGAIIILRNIEERKALEQQLFAATLTDPLTNLTNRRAFSSMLQYHLDVPVAGCLAIFDIDDFRSINREHGHAAGDKVLTTVAKLLRALLRKDDIISRIGGERFAVLLSQTTPDEAEMLCQRVVRTLAEASGSGPRITVSAGVSRIDGTMDDTMKRADAAVVIAKAKGRNRLEMEAGMSQRWIPDRLALGDES